MYYIDLDKYRDINDDSHFIRKFYNKRVNAKKEGIGFFLSIDDFASLLREAKITSSMCGIGGYHLARYNDSGAYIIGNCRFILAIDNYRERKVSEYSREASRKNILLYHEKETEEMKNSRNHKMAITKKGKNTWSKNSGLTFEMVVSVAQINNIVIESWGWRKKMAEFLPFSPVHIARMYHRGSVL